MPEGETPLALIDYQTSGRQAGDGLRADGGDIEVATRNRGHRQSVALLVCEAVDALKHGVPNAFWHRQCDVRIELEPFRAAA